MRVPALPSEGQMTPMNSKEDMRGKDSGTGSLADEEKRGSAGK